MPEVGAEIAPLAGDVPSALISLFGRVEKASVCQLWHSNLPGGSFPGPAGKSEVEAGLPVQVPDQSEEKSLRRLDQIPRLPDLGGVAHAL